jgi:peptidyl-prolyl cis-trans isomerase A (cyclophilin A)
MTIRSCGITAIALAALALPVAAQAPAAAPASKLRNPAAANEKAPATYKAKFDTSRGVFVIEVHRDWAPLGADRFYNLVKIGFFDDVRFFRVIQDPKPFMVQFGINGTPSVNTIWRSVKLADDPVKQSNKRGYVSFANTGQPDSRGTQVFINFGDNSFLDGQRFAPFGQVVQGLDNVVDKLYSDYGGKPQDQFVNILQEGNAFLNKAFPKLDYVKKATIEP